jgi:hypothetical protein
VLGWWGGWSGDVAGAEQRGADEQDSGTPPTLGITRPARHRPSGHKPSRPPMPQGLFARRTTAYPARPGRRPTQRRPATCLTTHKRAPKKTPGPARPFSASPVRRRPNRSSTANRWWQQNQDRRAASATTNAPAASGRTDPRLPKTGHSARAEVPQACPLRHAVFGAKGTAAASSDRSLLVTTTARPYGVTRQIAEAAGGQDHAHKPLLHRTSDICAQDFGH